jgi:hypothetical protein
VGMEYLITTPAFSASLGITDQEKAPVAPLRLPARAGFSIAAGYWPVLNLSGLVKIGSGLVCLIDSRQCCNAAYVLVMGHRGGDDSCGISSQKTFGSGWPSQDKHQP